MGYFVVYFNVLVIVDLGEIIFSDIDFFVIVRYIGLDGKEVFYIGIVGDFVLLIKGWFWVFMWKVNMEYYKYRFWFFYWDYISKDVFLVIFGDVYFVDIEVWVMNVIVEKGGRIVFEVLLGDM